MRTFPLVVLLLPVCGCYNPAPPAMVPRLPLPEQQAVDVAWQHMLNPPDHLDRGLLLDVIMRNYLHWYGVDRFEFVTEKALGHRKVVVSVCYVRDDPRSDELVFRYVDAAGNDIRRERYAGNEVRDRLVFWASATDEPGGIRARREREAQVKEATGGFAQDIMAWASLIRRKP